MDPTPVPLERRRRPLLYGALVTLSRFGKRYEAGLYRERATSLYVNRGIGMGETTEGPGNAWRTGVSEDLKISCVRYR